MEPKRPPRAAAAPTPFREPEPSAETIVREVLQAESDALVAALALVPAAAAQAAELIASADRQIFCVGVGKSGLVAAKTAATDFLNTIGYDAVDAGSLADSWRFEPGQPVYGPPYGTYEEPSGTPAATETIRAALAAASR